MKLLLDTHALIWALDSPERLPRGIRDLFRHPDCGVFVSAASVWEIALKAAVGRLQFPIQSLKRVMADAFFLELPVTVDHGLAAAQLPPLHQDPFDRMLIAQAMAESMTLVTKDRVVQQYPVDTLWD